MTLVAVDATRILPTPPGVGDNAIDDDFMRPKDHKPSQGKVGNLQLTPPALVGKNIPFKDLKTTPVANPANKPFKARFRTLEGAGNMANDQGIPNSSIRSVMVITSIPNMDLAEAWSYGFEETRERFNWLAYQVTVVTSFSHLYDIYLLSYTFYSLYAVSC